MNASGNLSLTVNRLFVSFSGFQRQLQVFFEPFYFNGFVYSK